MARGRTGSTGVVTAPSPCPPQPACGRARPRLHPGALARQHSQSPKGQQNQSPLWSQLPPTPQLQRVLPASLVGEAEVRAQTSPHMGMGNMPKAQRSGLPRPRRVPAPSPEGLSVLEGSRALHTGPKLNGSGSSQQDSFSLSPQQRAADRSPHQSRPCPARGTAGRCFWSRAVCKGRKEPGLSRSCTTAAPTAATSGPATTVGCPSHDICSPRLTAQTGTSGAPGAGARMEGRTAAPPRGKQSSQVTFPSISTAGSG